MQHTLSRWFPWNMRRSFGYNWFSCVCLVTSLKPVFCAFEDVLNNFLLIWFAKIQNYIHMLVFVFELAWIRFLSFKFNIIICDKIVRFFNWKTWHSVYWWLSWTRLSQWRCIWKQIWLDFQMCLVIIKWNFPVFCYYRVAFDIHHIWILHGACFVQKLPLFYIHIGFNSFGAYRSQETIGCAICITLSYVWFFCIEIDCLV